MTRLIHSGSKYDFFSESLEKLNLEYFWPRATKQATLNESWARESLVKSDFSVNNYGPTPKDWSIENGPVSLVNLDCDKI